MKQLTTFAACILFSIASFATGTPCKGVTKAGQPCKAYAMKNTLYCFAHSANMKNCTALTKDGKKCQISCKGPLCHIHSKGR